MEKRMPIGTIRRQKIRGETVGTGRERYQDDEGVGGCSGADGGPREGESRVERLSEEEGVWVRSSEDIRLRILDEIWAEVMGWPLPLPTGVSEGVRLGRGR